jgi:hypothetical protein
MTDERKAAEEAKRDRMWDPAERWKVLQDTIAWAESQPTVRRNTREACLKKQAMLLAAMGQAVPAEAAEDAEGPEAD